MNNAHRLLLIPLVALLVASFYTFTQDTAHAANEPIPKVSADTETEDAETDADAGGDRKQGLIAGLTIFVLAVFVGFEIITKVPATLHTPLMSGSNAISGITLAGAVIVAGISTTLTLGSLLGCVAVALATVNVVGGFVVTHRMLAKFQKKPAK